MSDKVPFSMSEWQSHVMKWHDCTRCHLQEVRQNVCLARGSIPCDVLFIGEAPGESEDSTGLPFIGPVGKLMDEMLGASLIEPYPEISYALTNLVGCIPRLGDGDKATKPDIESIKACTPRLQEIVWIANPKLIFAVGDIAQEWTSAGGNNNRKRGVIKLHTICPKCHYRQYENIAWREFDSRKALPERREARWYICANNHREESSVPIPMVDLVHPGNIIRLNIAQRGLKIQRQCVIIQNSIVEYVIPWKKGDCYGAS